MVDNS